MKIDVYIGKNEPGWSLYVLGHDIADGLSAAGNDVQVCFSIGKFRAEAVVLNLLLEEVFKVEKSRRFNGIGPQVCLFAGNTQDYPEAEIAGHLAHFAGDVTLLVHSQYHCDSVTRLVKQWFHPIKAKTIMANLRLVWGGASITFHQPNKTPDQKTKDFLVPYNRINQQQKNLGVHLWVTEKVTTLLSKRGMQMTHDFLLKDDGSLEAIKDIDRNGAYTPVPQPTSREEYKNLLAGYKIAICTSHYESLGLMYLELLMSGVVVVFLDKPWVHKLLPDYKLVAKNKNDLVGMVLEVTKNYDKAWSYVMGSVADFILQERSHEKFCVNLNTQLHELVSE